MRRGRNSTPQKTKRAQSKERRREPSYTTVRAHPIAKDAKGWGTLKIIRFVALCGEPRSTARNRRATKPELGGVVEWGLNLRRKLWLGWRNIQLLRTRSLRRTTSISLCRRWSLGRRLGWMGVCGSGFTLRFRG